MDSTIKKVELSIPEVDMALLKELAKKFGWSIGKKKSGIENRPHKLSGKLAGLWKCHIKGDWLLIWQQNDTELILIMTDTGTHADLF